MNIGEKIKIARIGKGYTQEELGKLLGVQKSAVAKYESGRVVNIKRSVLNEISKILEIPPIELVCEDFDKKPLENAELHAKILTDKDLLEMVKVYYSLSSEKQSTIRNLVKQLSEG